MVTKVDDLSQVRLFDEVIFIVEFVKQGAKPNHCFFLVELRFLVSESQDDLHDQQFQFP